MNEWKKWVDQCAARNYHSFNVKQCFFFFLVGYSEGFPLISWTFVLHLIWKPYWRSIFLTYVCKSNPKTSFFSILWTLAKTLFFWFAQSTQVKSYKCNHIKLFKLNCFNMLSNQNQVPNKHTINHWTISKSI
jgi:hypothetical protein